MRLHARRASIYRDVEMTDGIEEALEALCIQAAQEGPCSMRRASFNSVLGASMFMQQHETTSYLRAEHSVLQMSFIEQYPMLEPSQCQPYRYSTTPTMSTQSPRQRQSGNSTRAGHTRPKRFVRHPCRNIVIRIHSAWPRFLRSSLHDCPLAAAHHSVLCFRYRDGPHMASLALVTDPTGKISVDEQNGVVSSRKGAKLNGGKEVLQGGDSRCMLRFWNTYCALLGLCCIYLMIFCKTCIEYNCPFSLDLMFAWGTFP